MWREEAVGMVAVGDPGLIQEIIQSDTLETLEVTVSGDLPSS